MHEYWRHRRELLTLNQTFRCAGCEKKLFEGNLALLVEQKTYEEGEDEKYIEVLCHRCKHLNRFTYDPSKTVQK